MSPAPPSPRQAHQNINDISHKSKLHPPVIKTQDLTKIYSGEGDAEVRALNGVDVSVYRGEYVALMGTSGSGKSTLMHILGCLDSPSSGQYYLDGQNVHELNEAGLARIRNEHIGFIFQAFNLLPRTSAVDNVALPLVYRGVSTQHRTRLACTALKRVGLGDRLEHKPNELSGGQKQRVAIARALVQDPTILLADEPTGNLDSKSTHDILSLFDELHREGRTILMVTHEDDVGARADRIIHMQDGRIVTPETQAMWSSSHFELEDNDNEEFNYSKRTRTTTMIGPDKTSSDK